MLNTKYQKLISGKIADIYSYDRGRVMKLYHDEYADFCDLEYKLASYINVYNLPTPKAYEQIRFNDRPGIIFGQVSGSSWHKIIDDDAVQVFGIAKKMAAFHFIIHNQISEHLPPIKDRLQQIIRDTNLPKELDKLYILQHLAKLPNGNSICHMNFLPENIIDAPKSPAILNWLSGGRGHYLTDVWQTYLLLSLPSNFSSLPFLGRLKKKAVYFILKHLYLQRYSSLAQKNIKNYRSWLLPLAAAYFEIAPEEDRLYLSQVISQETIRLKKELE